MCPMKHFYPKRDQSDVCPALSGASVSVVLVAAVHCGNGTAAAVCCSVSRDHPLAAVAAPAWL